MKYWMKLAMLALLLSSAALAEQFTGWITDAKCAKTGNYSGDMHQKCVASGQPLVFVNESDKKIYDISNPEHVKESVGRKVTLNGTLKDDTIETESVTVIIGSADEQ